MHDAGMVDDAVLLVSLSISFATVVSGLTVSFLATNQRRAPRGTWGPLVPAPATPSPRPASPNPRNLPAVAPLGDPAAAAAPAVVDLAVGQRDEDAEWR